ncbi:pyridoxal phosphate-dependent transferase [Mycena galopus ATCC 62051]|nr:pyridoxal phosphate-dependent transferase [Mycena galopus ATCC 62051]
MLLPRSYTFPPLDSRRTEMRPLTLNLLNAQLQAIQCPDRSQNVIEACDAEPKSGNWDQNPPSGKVILSNNGNLQEVLHQLPITFTRQVAALTEWPALADVAPGLFPDDVIARAKELLGELGSIGAYAHNKGVPLIRKSVAKFIEDRDGFPAVPEEIFLTAGASGGISLLLNLLITDSTSGILIPEHQLYTATVAKHDGRAIPYFLDESSSWSTISQQVLAALAAARKEGTTPKALVVINPSRTGNLLSSPTMEGLVRLCEEHELVLLADEVYQNDLHDAEQNQFTSFKKVVRVLNSPIPLVSFHSISKGVSGECGRRGGYFELCNISPDVTELIYRLVSAGLDPPLSGQIAVDSMVRPPKEGEPSYALWKLETDAIRRALHKRARV